MSDPERKKPYTHSHSQCSARLFAPKAEVAAVVVAAELVYISKLKPARICSI